MIGSGFSLPTLERDLLNPGFVMKRWRGKLLTILVLLSLTEATGMARERSLGSIAPLESDFVSILPLDLDPQALVDNVVSNGIVRLSHLTALNLGASSAKFMPLYQNGAAGIEFQMSF